jgi:hypothetical protein
MAAFWAVFTFGGSGPALTAHGSLDLKQEIQIYIVNVFFMTHKSAIALLEADVFTLCLFPSKVRAIVTG